MTPKSGFYLDPVLERDTIFVTDLRLSSILLMDDCRYPWLIIVPRVGGAEEIFDLGRGDQSLLMDEIAMVAEAVHKVTNPAKVNVGALGNIVRQLHIHVIARFETDATWPGPVWGVGERTPYEDCGAAFLSLLNSEIGLSKPKPGF
ncbi:MAG: HIT family protein [Pseudomonadota bacterium]